MAYNLNQTFNTESFKAASNISFGGAVQLSASTAFQILPASAASNGGAPVYGIALASAGSVGMNVPVQTGGWAKAFAGASLGIGAYVGVGIGTSSLVPVMPSQASVGLGSKFVIGTALEAATAGALFTVAIHPIQVI
jgi:hypothetical protein